MALIVEDGTGKSNAQAYVDVATVDAYFTVRQSSVWPAALSTAAKEAAIIKATQFIDAQYRNRWKGRKNTKAQALTWPRFGASIDNEGDDMLWIPGMGQTTSGFSIDQTEIPQLLKDASCELALRAVTLGDLAPDIGIGAGAVIEETVGPITVRYAQGRVPVTIYRFAAAILEPLLSRGGSIAEVARR